MLDRVEPKANGVPSWKGHLKMALSSGMNGSVRISCAKFSHPDESLVQPQLERNDLGKKLLMFLIFVIVHFRPPLVLFHWLIHHAVSKLKSWKQDFIHFVPIRTCQQCVHPPLFKRITQPGRTIASWRRWPLLFLMTWWFRWPASHQNLRRFERPSKISPMFKVFPSWSEPMDGSS